MRVTKIDIIDVASYSISYAFRRAYLLLKVNSFIVLMFLLGLSSIQIYQERKNPVIVTNSITPYIIETDNGVYNYCFKWNIDILRESKLTQFQWILKSSSSEYFVVPWIKKEGRFRGMITPEHFNKGAHEYEMCVTLPKYQTGVSLQGYSIFRISIFGIPWSNSYKYNIIF